MWVLFNAAPDAIVVVNAGGRVVFANTATERTFGVSRRELEGAPLVAVLPARLRDEVDAFVAAPPPGPTGARFSIDGRHRDGRELSIEVTLSSVEIDSARFIIAAMRTTSINVRNDDELVRTLHEARRETAGVRDELDRAPITVVRLDRRGRITHANDAWRQFARANGANDATITGVGLDYVAAARGDETETTVADALVSMLAGHRETFETLYPCHSPAGLRWFQLSAQRIAADDGVVLFHSNVTARRQAEMGQRLRAIVGTGFAQRQPLIDVCRLALTATSDGLEWDIGAVWLPGAGALSCAEVWARPPLLGSSFELATRAMRIPLGHGLLGRAGLGEPEWIRDIAHHPDFLRTKPAVDAGLRSGFAVPLKAEGEVVAVVEFFSRVQREPDATLLEVLATAGASIAHQVRLDRALQHVRVANDAASEAREALAAAEHVVRDISDTLGAVARCTAAIVVAVDAAGIVRFTNGSPLAPLAVGGDWLAAVPAEHHDEHWSHFRAVLETKAPQRYEACFVGERGAVRCSIRMCPMYSGDVVVGAALLANELTSAAGQAPTDRSEIRPLESGFTEATNVDEAPFAFQDGVVDHGVRGACSDSRNAITAARPATSRA